MTLAERAIARFVAWADTFGPAGAGDIETLRRVRVAVAESSLGLVFTAAMAALYAAMGSPVAALALAAVFVGLAFVPSALRAGTKIEHVGNAMMALAFGSILVVAFRTSGFESPAVAWMFLLPLSVYPVAGRAAAIVWASLAALGLFALFVATRAGSPVAHDLAPGEATILRILGFAGVLGATLALLLVLDAARIASVAAQRAAERALDRQRILDDMHDGVGSQLLGLLVQARAGALPESELATGLESCLDDLRLIVDSLDPLNAPLDVALHALRARLRPRFEAASIELAFDVDDTLAAAFAPSATMQALRALQEMLGNALRHARAHRVGVRIGRLPDTATMELAVVDDGIGLVSDSPRRGRGLKSLETRARALGGRLVLAPRERGLRVAIELPVPR